jgi:hypothetical protein
VRDTQASVELRMLIGADKLRERYGDAFAGYECWRCGGTGRAAEPTPGIVLAHRVCCPVQLSYPGCPDSQILEVGVAGMRPLVGERERRDTASKPGEQVGSLAETNPARGCLA